MQDRTLLDYDTQRICVLDVPAGNIAGGLVTRSKWLKTTGRKLTGAILRSLNTQMLTNKKRLSSIRKNWKTKLSSSTQKFVIPGDEYDASFPQYW